MSKRYYAGPFRPGVVVVLTDEKRRPPTRREIEVDYGEAITVTNGEAEGLDRSADWVTSWPPGVTADASSAPDPSDPSEGDSAGITEPGATVEVDG